MPNIVYGYDKTIGDYFILTINKDEAANVFDLYTKEGYGAAKIAEMLNLRDLKTKRHCQWSQNGICRIFTNELYTGKIINGKQEVQDFLTGVRMNKDETERLVTDRPDLRIIDPAQFEQAQQIMTSRGNNARISNIKTTIVANTCIVY